MTKDYAQCTNLDDIKAVMKENGVIYKKLSPEDKKFYIKLKNQPIPELAEQDEVTIEEVVLNAEEEAKQKEARAAAQKAGSKDSPDKYLHIRNGIMDQLFKKFMDGKFRAKLRMVKKLECTSLVALKSQLQVLIDTAESGAGKLIIKKYLKELDA